MEAPPRFELGNKGFAGLIRGFSPLRKQSLKKPVNPYIMRFVGYLIMNSKKSVSQNISQKFSWRKDEFQILN